MILDHDRMTLVCMQGTHKTKTRAEVSGGGRKPRPQKGQGKARIGTIRAGQVKNSSILHL